MVVEAIEGGGSGAGRELLARAEVEVKKEMDIEGNKVSITCREGDDNDGSGTDGSFVMVMADGDMNERSDSSENDMNMGSVAAAGAGCSRDLMDTNSDSMSFLDDAMIGKEEGEGDECEEEIAKRFMAVLVDPEQDIKESVKTDVAEREALLKDLRDDEEHGYQKETTKIDVLKEAGSGLATAEDHEDEKYAIIEELGDNEVVVDCESLKNEKDAVIEDLSNEDDAKAGENLKIEVAEKVARKDEAMDDKGLNKEGLNEIKEDALIVKGFEKDVNKEGLSGAKDEGLIVKDIEKEVAIEDLIEEDEGKSVVGKDSKNQDETEVANREDLDTVNDEAMEDRDLNIEEQIEVIEKAVIVKDVENELAIEYLLEVTMDGEDSKKKKDDEVVSREDSENFKDESLENKDLNRDEPSTVEAEVVIVKDFETIVIIEDLNEDELIRGTEIASGVSEAPYAENELGNSDEKPVVESSSAQSSSLTHDRSFKLEVEFDKTDSVEYIYHSEEPSKVGEQQAGDAHLSITDKKEPAVYSDLEEIRDANGEAAVKINISELANEKKCAAFKIEDKKDDNHDDCKDPAEKRLDSKMETEETKKIIDEKLSGDTESKIIDYMEEADCVYESKLTDQSPDCIDSKNENSSVIQMYENLQTNAEAEISEKGHDLSIEFADDSANKNNDSDSLEEYEKSKNNDLSIEAENAKVLPSSNSDPLDLEPKEGLNFPHKIEEEHNSIDSNLEPIAKCLVLASEETLDANPSSIDSISEEDIISVSKSEETQNAEKTKLKSVIGVLKSGAEIEHSKIQLSTEAVEDQNKELKSEKADLLAKKYRMIRIPRFSQRKLNIELQAKITDAQAQVNEHTQNRDSLKADIDGLRKVLSDCFHKRNSANEEEKKAKALLNAKRLEMESFQSAVSKGKAATSFLDIVSQIKTLEHKMQHETISLKDEKKCLHDLHQLKHEQEHHFFSKCSRPEIDEAIKQKDLAESSLRDLKREFDILRSAHLRADECAKAAGKSYIDQFSKVKDHEKKWKVANELRQNAYKCLHDLKSDKMELYWKYMEDRQAAKKYASSRDFESLEQHCIQQVERIMRLWNEDDDFRQHYVESNAGNTLRKFGTSDGRTPDPTDTVPLLPHRVSPARVTVHDDRPVLAPKPTKPAPPAVQKAKSSLLSINDDVVSPREEFVEEKPTKEEEEQARKKEELIREREAVKLKEKLRMEQKAKAKEAEERKRRKVEKAQVRADYKAQKEAEVRELKRAKKEMKKEITPENSRSVEGELALINETAAQEAGGDRTQSSKSRKRSAAALNKYSTKAQEVPLPLRNRGKRKMTPWLWTLCVAAAFACLFFAGNYVSFSVSWINFGFK